MRSLPALVESHSLWKDILVNYDIPAERFLMLLAFGLKNEIDNLEAGACVRGEFKVNLLLWGTFKVTVVFSTGQRYSSHVSHSLLTA